jgi:hypothetical protein
MLLESRLEKKCNFPDGSFSIIPSEWDIWLFFIPLSYFSSLHGNLFASFRT